MSRDDTIDFPTHLGHDFVKHLRLRANQGRPGLAFQNFEQIALENEPLLGKVDHETTIRMRVGKVHQFHRSAPVGNGPSIRDQLNLSLPIGLRVTIRLQGVRPSQEFPHHSFIQSVGNDGRAFGGIGAYSPLVVRMVMGRDHVADGLISYRVPDLTDHFQRLHLVGGSIGHQNKILEFHPHVALSGATKVDPFGQLDGIHRNGVQVSQGCRLFPNLLRDLE